MIKEEWFGDEPQLIIKTPATSANMGPGFDCLGMAVNLYNELWIKKLSPKEKTVITAEGYGEDRPQTLDNLIYKTYEKTMRSHGLEVVPLAMHCINRVPFARGLGSSSAAAVSGLITAQVISDNYFSLDDLMQMATAIDGHPDNVLPALLGGIVVGCMTGDHKVIAKKMQPVEGLHAYALIPEYPLPTSKSRAVMPDTYSREDVVYNLGHLGYLVATLSSGTIDGLAEAFSDKVHEPYRLPLMPGLQEAKEIALRQGALAAIVSGAGSTMLILSDAKRDFRDTQEALKKLGYASELIEVAPIANGVKCYRDEMELELWP